MELSDIQKTITIILHENFPTYKIVLKQECDIVKPTFFVNVKKIKTINNISYKDKFITVTITYVNKEYDHVENNIINDKLDDLFESILKVNDEYLDIEDLNFNEPDALICSFNLNIREQKVNNENYKKMEELIQKY